MTPTRQKNTTRKWERAAAKGGGGRGISTTTRATRRKQKTKREFLLFFSSTFPDLGLFLCKHSGAGGRERGRKEDERREKERKTEIGKAGGKKQKTKKGLVFGSHFWARGRFRIRYTVLTAKALSELAHFSLFSLLFLSFSLFLFLCFSFCFSPLLVLSVFLSPFFSSELALRGG